jgi:hypothetical protein
MFCCNWKSLVVFALFVTSLAGQAESSVVIRPVLDLHGFYDMDEPPFAYDIPFDIDLATEFSSISNVQLRLVGSHQQGTAVPLGGGAPEQVPAVVAIELLNDLGNRAASGGGLLSTNSRLDSMFALNRGPFVNMPPFHTPPDYSPLLDGKASLVGSYQPPALIAIFGQVDGPTVDVSAAALIVTGDVPGKLAGDFDGDGAVFGGDYRLWRDTFGSTVEPGMGADGNGNGIVEAGDYTYWRRGFRASIRPTNGYLAGDYDYIGRVDNEDYYFWQNSFGNHVAPFSFADGNGDGFINAADYMVWRDQRGQSLPGAAAAVGAVPEPATCVPVALATVLLAAHRWTRRTQ